MYFCIDALEQMQQDEHVDNLDFFPLNCTNIYLVASCIKGFELPIASLLDKFGRCIEDVPLLTLEDIREVIEGLSSENSKNISESICAAMLKKKI